MDLVIDNIHFILFSLAKQGMHCVSVAEEEAILHSEVAVYLPLPLPQANLGIAYNKEILVIDHTMDRPFVFLIFLRLILQVVQIIGFAVGQ